MANHFRKGIDRLRWGQVAPAPNAHAAGTALCADLRSDVSRTPFVYQLASAAVLNRYNIFTKGWNFVQSPALAGTFGVGAGMVFAPSFGAVGTIAAGATTSSFTLSTALPTAVGVNMLANRGGSSEFGFKVRLIDTASGKTEERFIVANTGGTTPKLWVGTPFTFTPAIGARYEIMAGRVFMLGAGTTAANIWRSLEVAANTLSSGLSTTNLPATIGTDSALVCLDEQYTPFDMNPGEGLVKGSFLYDSGQVSDRYALTATAAGASSLTGQASGGDAVLVANEMRNMQIRIVQDTTNPTAVGQRRIIASHTAGASPVYTLGTAWTVTPSATCKYVVELPNLILVRSSATTSVYAYNYMDAAINNGTNSIATGAWSTAYIGVAPAANAASGQWAPSWGIQPDAGRNARHSFCYFFRGGSATVDLLDLAGGTTGAWSSAVVIDGAVTLTTGTCAAYAPFDNEGRMTYLNIYTASAINQIYRFDVQNRVLSPYCATDFLQSGTAAVGGRLAAFMVADADQNYDVLLLQSHLSTIAQELMALV